MTETELDTYPRKEYKTRDLRLTINCRGTNDYTKVSYPVKYGLFSRLETRDRVFEFNLNHEIRHAKSKKSAWLHPSEWLKRSMGNDWIYYSSGGYAGVYEAIGEYYLPNLMYKTNSLLGGKPFLETEISDICSGWDQTITQLPGHLPGMPRWAEEWIQRAKQITPGRLRSKAEQLFKIPGSRVSVLPPDARHSDYDVIPLNIADGCLYKCRFCKIKNKKTFALKSKQEILDQIRDFKKLYGPDLVNINGLFLGEHDALSAPADLILFAVQRAFEAFNFSKSYMKRPRLYLFGSVDALLNANPKLFPSLNALPLETFINLGLESFDQDTLDRLGKPITRIQVAQAFEKAQTINQKFSNIEITCNFVMDDGLGEAHTRAMLDLVREGLPHNMPKGSVYLSPLAFGRPSREILFDFYHLKTLSRLPMFLYIIQRL